MAMDVPGGIVVRPLERIYSPTFWPAQSFVHFQDSASGRGVALCLAMPGAVACRPDGTLELVALRNATGERAFGFLPLLGMTVSGHETSRHVCEYALLFTEAGDWRENSIPLDGPETPRPPVGLKRPCRAPRAGGVSGDHQSTGSHGDCGQSRLARRRDHSASL